jgi:copper(I)-binding protein
MLNRLTLLLATLLAASLVQAHGTHAGTIHIEQAQARASVGNQSNGAAFLTIENQGKTDDVLQSVAAPVAGKVEIHTMTMEGDVMKMRAVERLDIKAGEKIEMKPGQGYHIMLMGLKKPLKAGESFPMQLSFRKAGKVQLTVTVMEAGAATKSNQDEQMHQHHHHQ